jgi:hypothetical protein
MAVAMNFGLLAASGFTLPVPTRIVLRHRSLFNDIKLLSQAVWPVYLTSAYLDLHFLVADRHERVVLVEEVPVSFEVS